MKEYEGFEMSLVHDIDCWMAKCHIGDCSWVSAPASFTEACYLFRDHKKYSHEGGSS